MSTLLTIIIFLIILSILIAVHEFGHFIVAKLNGIRVDTFAIGFKPTLWKKKFRGTEYKINAIPLGGYVHIFGESFDDVENLSEESGEFKQSFVSKKWWQQILVLVAGIVMNLVLAWIVFAWALMIGAPTIVQQPTNPQTPITVLSVVPGSPADNSGIKIGHQIQSVTPEPFATIENDRLETVLFPTPSELSDAVKNLDITSPDNKLKLLVDRGEGEIEEISLYPKFDDNYQRNLIGVETGYVELVKTPFIQALGEGLSRTGSAFVGTFRGVGELISGKTSFQNLSGPVGIAGIVGDAQKLGFVYLLTITANISIALAVFNLLPFPALDGGRIVFVIVEAITRKRIKPKITNLINSIGFLLLILLMIVVTVKDVIHLV